MSTKRHQKSKSSSKKPVLNPRRLMFCKEYLVDFNGTQAAMRAGFSRHTANEQASRLLANVSVQAEIDRLRKAREDRLEASADFVVRELMRVSKFDIRQAFDKDGSLKDIHSMPEDITRCLASVEIKDLFEGTGKDREQVGFTKTIRAWDKIRALEALGEHFGIFKRAGETPEAKKKLDLLQVIKLLSKDGTTTIIENRIGEGQAESPRVDKLGSRGLVIV